MTYIKSVKMHGFKSFAKPTELVFDKNLSVVVGPNGAGKSNVTDAICFVLGRLSMKSIRASRASNLIYHGGKENRPAEEASVELIFDNSNKIFGVDGDVILERIVKKDGNSIYRINNETKTRQEVLELLSQAGIDPMGFNIILQGEIARFVEMHSEERRQVIEEIAGISVYEDRKAKSLNELERTDEKLKEVNAVLNERRAYLKNLEEERGEALKYKKHEETVKKCKATLFHKNLDDKEKEIKTANEEIEKKEKFLESKRQELEKLIKSIYELKEEAEKISKHIQEETGIKHEGLQNEIIELKQDLAGLSVRKENFEFRIEQNEGRKKQFENSIKEYEQQIEELKKAKPKAGAASKSQELLEKKKKELEDAEKKRAEFYKTRQKYTETKNRLGDKKELFQRIKNQGEFILKQIEASSLELSELTEDFEKVTKKLEELKAKHEHHKTLIEKNRGKFIELEKEISKKEVEIIRQQKIKQDVSKIDICPLCKTKITKEHVSHVIQEADRISEEFGNELSELKEGLHKLNESDAKIRKEIEEHASLIRKKEFDLKHIKDIATQKEHLRKLNEDESKITEELSELEKQSARLEKQVNDFGKIEEICDNLKIEISELSEIGSEDKDAQLSMKTIELERTKNIIKSILREQEENESALEEVSSELEEKQAILEEKEQQEKVLQEKFRGMYGKKTALQEKIIELEKEQIKTESSIKQEEDSFNNMKINRARIKAEHETIMIEFKEFEGTEFLSGSREKIQEQLKNAQEALIRIGSVNMRALEVYDKIKKQYDDVAEKSQKLEAEKTEILNIIADIDKKKKKAFMNVFTAINEKFQNNWGRLSSKGLGYLEIENEENPFEGGIRIVQKVAKGKYMDANSLSGGERVLMALALIFAIQEYRPYHFYIFDEIDAALDKRNSERLAGLIKSQIGNAQYIVISHNDSIISESGERLYGVTMQDGISKVLSLKV